MKEVVEMSKSIRDSVMEKAKRIKEGSKDYQPGEAYKEFKKEKEKWLQREDNYLKKLEEMMNKS